MRILMVSSFLHHRGGDTTCLFATTEGLEARGHEVIPFAMRHPDNLPSVWETRFPPQVDARGARGLAKVRAFLDGIWSREAARAIEALVRDVRPDVAHLHHVHRHLSPSILGPLRRHGVPVVWTVHDYELVCPNAALYTGGSECHRCRDGSYRHAIEHRCKRDSVTESTAVAIEKAIHARLRVLDRVDLLVCPSRWLADRLVEFGADPRRVIHVPNGLAEAPAGGPPGDYWLFAGRLAPEKGIDDLLAAARLLPHRFLRILGGGEALDRIRREAPPNVEVRGKVSPAQVANELRGAAAVAVPSRWPENFPYAVLEAQMAGRAVVASGVGGIPEQITDGVDGLLVPPAVPSALAGRIEALFREPAVATRIGTAARARVLAERGMGPFLDSMESIYRSVR